MTLAARPRLAILFVALAALFLSLTGAPVQAQDGSVPAQPTGLSTEASHDRVNLTWDDANDASITHYKVLRRDRDIHDTGEFVTIDSNTGSGTTNYTDDTVEPEKRYVYRVKAVNQHGVSKWSKFARANTPAAPTPAPTPEPTPEPTPGPTPEPNTPATGAPTISGTVQVGETLTADTSGIYDADGLDDVAYSYQWLADDVDIAGAAGGSYTPVDADVDKSIKVRVGFTDGGGNPESLTSEATATVTAAVTPLTAEFQDAPDKHLGTGFFTFLIAFSEPISISYVTLRDDSLDVTNGSATKAKRVNGQNDRWEITVKPDSDADVTVVLPVTGDCTAQDAVCTRDGTKLSNRSELTVPGPAAANSPATGAPSIGGTAQVGETLKVDTSGISDADGLDDVAYSYQWLADDADIAGAAGGSYTLVDAEQGKSIKVRVGFTDDGGNPESLTSTATAPVDPAADETEYSCPIVSATLTVGRVRENYGYHSFLNPRAGSLIPDSFVLDDVTYTVGSIQTEADYFTVFGVDRELPVGFTLEVDGVQFESRDASLGSHTYGHVYTWLGRGMDWDVG